ncbi:MAG TPA: fatty acid desaturase [Pyrinomonadaceae bacterium]|jgi:stearoyl-CoA desaturase (delta-9 desaturase)
MERATAFEGGEDTAINWPTSITLIIFHIAAVAALFMFTWQALAVAFVLWWVAGSLGVGMGFHRLLTHRGYKVPKVVEYFLAVCGSLALEGGHIDWVVTHRIHHAHTDAPGDPHTPRDGGWWAHVGWVLRGTAQKHSPQVMARYAPDLLKDRFHVLLNKLYWVPLVVVGAALLAFGGWSVFMWGIFLRITFNLHSTWLVNSATHMWGKRRFVTTDDSTNCWWVALLTFGEGWHNNHHAHPRAARHGLAWYEVDFNWWGIRALELLGLAKDIKLISPAAVAAAASAAAASEPEPLRRAA